MPFFGKSGTPRMCFFKSMRSRPSPASNTPHFSRDSVSRAKPVLPLDWVPGGAMAADWIEETRGRDALVLTAKGRWLAVEAAAINLRLAAVKAGDARRVRIDLTQLEALDTTGAWLLLRLQRALGKRDAEVSLDNLPPEFAPLLR